ncbi:MAG: class I SAM-dependent methyltransferase [Candidatus Aegiribacteria sp.]|nr:class I SAM-dependent methyltransferase [Candidatus Aegiribacteria sp.]
MIHQPETWEHVWKDRASQNGLIPRAGRLLASHGDLQKLVMKILKRNCRIMQNTRILEVGCGSGPVAGRLKRLTPMVYGVDISRAAAELTSETGVSVAVTDARELPFKDGSFDLVYSTGVVDLFDDASAAAILREMVRVTCSGGRTVIITAWKGCRLHETIKNYLIRKGRWRYGPKRTFASLEPFLQISGIRIREKSMGAFFQFRFVSYLFEEHKLARRMYHGVYLVLSILLRPLNRLPGAILVTMAEKE